MEINILLKDLMSVSDKIENRINDMMVSCIQSEFDINDSQNLWINEAIKMLIGLLEENGIHFHYDIDDIISDRYSVGFIIFLYRNFSTVNVVQTIKSTPSYLEQLNAGLINVPNNEILIHMLDIMRKLTISYYHNEAYGYLFDKVYNDDQYMYFIFSTIDILNTQQDEMYIIFDDNDKEFIEKLTKERHWFERCLVDLMHKGALPLDSNRSKQLIQRFCMIYSSPENINILSKYDRFVTEQKSVIDKLMHNIHRRSDIHIEYYTDSDISKLQICTVVAIILAKISDFHLFGIEPDFDKLIQFCSSDIPIKNLIAMIPINR